MPADPVPITPALLADWPLPEPGKDKEARGRVLVLGGTAMTPGAVLLAGEAVLRAGGGKLQIATARPVAAALAVAVPEALVVALPTTDQGDIAPAAADEVLGLADSLDTILIGPGFASVESTVALLEPLVPKLSCPVVIDAVASAYLTKHRDALAHLDGRAVLTLNPSELAMTGGREPRDVESDPLGAASDLAAQTGAVVLCGAEGKTVAAPDGQAWTSDTGGPGLGISGSGDVQAGLVAALLGRGAEPAQAACWGGHLHGSAGDELAAALGAVGFLAREISGRIPGLLERLARG